MIGSKLRQVRLVLSDERIADVVRVLLQRREPGQQIGEKGGVLGHPLATSF